LPPTTGTGEIKKSIVPELNFGKVQNLEIPNAKKKEQVNQSSYETSSVCSSIGSK